ncbi:EAL domain-containing protein [Komagataeibacter sp. FXV3]|uniref:EAL domain-containing protein n=1 Tax=Komagataeibacter sp. FXV3 TaxID=2608998 RepID=UPI00187B86EC|nr:EAL domain-containing protein [Komagataeibacter sp. FXV3]MBE7728901.1 EAL domain-containing protein [Komagataeibacter sp. FXV3]
MKQNASLFSKPYHSLSGTNALQVLHGATDGVVVIDERNRIVFFNAAAEKLWGYTQSEVIGYNVNMLLPAGMRDEHDAFVERNRSTGINTIIGTSREIRFENRAGEYVAGELALSMITLRPDLRKYYLATIKGMPEESHRRNLQALQNTVFRALSSDMSVRDIGDLICRETETFVPDTVAVLILVEKDRRLRVLSGAGFPRRYAAAVENITLSDADIAALARNPAHAGTLVWKSYSSLGRSLGLHHCRASAIVSPDGAVTGIFGLFSRNPDQKPDGPDRIVSGCVPFCGAVIEQYEARQHIAQLASYDPLTGFLNRSAAHDVLARLVGQPGDNHFAVLLLNVDRFRDINEALGHGNGDLLLRALATRMRTLSPDSYVLSRSSADEFIIILPDTQPDTAVAFVTTLLKGLTQPVEIRGNYIVPSVSAGISMFPHTGPDSESLIGLAETAMRQAKKDAPGTYRIATPARHDAARERLLPGRAMRETLQRGLLHLHYQPQLRTRSGHLYGVEALPRWHHPHLGNIFPARFIAVAEDTGQIDTIGTWALEAACRQISAWDRDAIHVPAVAVNLSAGLLRKRHLPEMIAGMLETCQLAPQRLTVGLTEQVMMDDDADTMAVLHAIRALGVGLSMDDFGTGSSSLSRLARLPLSEIRIDHSFIANLEHDANAQAMTTAVIGMGGMLGMTVAGGGVETESQKTLLEHLHCDVMQGHLFSRPLTATELGPWVRDRITKQ